MAFSRASDFRRTTGYRDYLYRDLPGVRDPRHVPNPRREGLRCAVCNKHFAWQPFWDHVASAHPKTKAIRIDTSDPGTRRPVRGATSESSPDLSSCQLVSHAKYGDGVLLAEYGDKIRVQFLNEEKPRLFKSWALQRLPDPPGSEI